MRYAAMILFVMLRTTVLAAQRAATPTLRAQSTLVLVPTLVASKGGELVYTLTADDFRLTDNTVEQKLTLEEDQGAQPLALVVVVEVGGAGARELPIFRKLGTMIEGVPGGVRHAIAVVDYDSEPELVQPFTASDSEVSRTMRGLESGDGGAATLDALKFAIDLLRKRPAQERRAILLISETIDHGSHIALTDAIRAISDTNTAVYSLAFSTSKSEMKHEAPQIFGQINLFGVAIGPPAAPGPAGGCMSRATDPEQDPDAELPGSRFQQTWDCLSLLAPPLRVAKMAAMLARNALRENVPLAVAHITGGEYIHFTTFKDMEWDLAAIANHVPNRYVLSFHPESPAVGMHAIELRLRDRPDLKVTARSDYWVDQP
jgi:VWFA-related protein